MVVSLESPLATAWKRTGVRRGGDDKPNCATTFSRKANFAAGVRQIFGKRTLRCVWLDAVRLATGCHACLACGKSALPRLARLDIETLMTPAARRMASELGSACCYAEAHRAAERGGGSPRSLGFTPSANQRIAHHDGVALSSFRQKVARSCDDPAAKSRLRSR